MGNGGSGGVRGGGSPPPTSGEQIVRNLFEGDAQKKLDSRQQTQALQEQSRQQQELRDASGQGHAVEHEGETRGEGAERRQASPQARLRGADAGQVKEKEIDSFLARASNQQAQREAGRQLARPQTLSSINPQAWTVGGSPHTPDGARNLIQNRQQAAAGQPQTQGQGTKTGQGQTAARGTPGLPLPTFTRAGSPLPNLAPLIIRYGPPLSSGGEKMPQAFTGRPMQLQQFRGQIQRLVQEQLGRAAAQNLGKEAQVAVHVRGNVVFVRDGDKTRAFKLDKEGNLTELPSDDAGEHPLSPEAQKVLEKVLRQKGLHAKLSHGETEHPGELSDAQLSERLGEQLAQKEEGRRGELDFETRFALLLHEVLEEGRGLGEELEGDPMFPSKKDWEAFFSNLMKMGNRETAEKKSMEAMLDLIFRGAFQKKGKGGYLVGDLKFLQSGKETEEKFAQMPLGEKQLQELLNAFHPGQKLGKEILAKLFGEEIDFLKMGHTEERSFNMASQAEKKVVFNPKASVDLYGQARLEKSILSSRKEKAQLSAFKDGSSDAAPPPPSGVPANVFELLGLKEKYQGQPRFYTLIFYAVFTALLAIIVGLLAMKLF